MTLDFALVPLKPLRMVQTSVYTPILRPESRLVAEFIACLRQEAKSLENRVAALLGNSLAQAAATANTTAFKKKQKDSPGNIPGDEELPDKTDEGTPP